MSGLKAVATDSADTAAFEIADATAANAPAAMGLSEALVSDAIVEVRMTMAELVSVVTLPKLIPVVTFGPDAVLRVVKPFPGGSGPVTGSVPVADESVVESVPEGNENL